MAFDAVLRWDDYFAVSVGDGCRPVQDKGDQKLVLFWDCQVMTVMTIYIFMHAFSPCVIRRLHQMAAHAEFWIILSEIIKLVRDYSATDHKTKQDSGNYDLAF